MAEETNIPTPPPVPQQAVDSAQPPVQPQPAPQPTQPVTPQNQPFYELVPLMQMTGGMKFGYCVLGFLMSLPGVLIAWLINADKVPPMKSDALKFSLIGFAVSIVIGIAFSMMLAGLIGVMMVGTVDDPSLFSSAASSF
ncbi:MAG: spore coat protein SP96 [Raoultibacter sp.]